MVCRYQQYRAARKIVERLRTGKTPEERSGVVWHTQGSGKSLTMVFVARMLRASTDLADFKMCWSTTVWTWRSSSPRTAKLIGGKVNVIESTAELREHLSTDASDVNMVMVHKFMERAEALPAVPGASAASARPTLRRPRAPSSVEQTFGVVNPSERIMLMIDEAHRTQGSDLGDNIFEAFPNATRIAFTGTPLITEQHGTKRTVKRFGEYIDTYKLMDAVHDGATLQILYEGRTADTAHQGQARLRHQVRGPLQGAQRGGDPRHQEEVRRHRRHPRSGEAHRGHRARPGRPLHRQHPARRLQGPGGLPLQAGGDPLPESDSQGARGAARAGEARSPSPTLS